MNNVELTIDPTKRTHIEPWDYDRAMEIGMSKVQTHRICDDSGLPLAADTYLMIWEEEIR